MFITLTHQMELGMHDMFGRLSFRIACVCVKTSGTQVRCLWSNAVLSSSYGTHMCQLLVNFIPHIMFS